MGRWWLGRWPQEVCAVPRRQCSPIGAGSWSPMCSLMCGPYCSSCLAHWLSVGLSHSKLSSLPGGAVVKNLPANAGDGGSTPGSRKIPCRRNWQPMPLSLTMKSNPMNKGASWARVYEVARVRHNLATKPPPPYIKSHSKLRKQMNLWFFSQGFLSNPPLTMS